MAQFKNPAANAAKTKKAVGEDFYNEEQSEEIQAAIEDKKAAAKFKNPGAKAAKTKKAVGEDFYNEEQSEKIRAAIAADNFEKEYIFEQLNSYYLDDEGLFYDGLHLIASTDVEAAQEYIQPGDLGVWYEFEGEISAPIKTYLLIGVETLGFIYESTLQHVEILYTTDEGNKLDARFGTDKHPVDLIASSIKELAEQMFKPDPYEISLTPTIKVRNFKADQLSIFTSNTISETETTSTTTSAY